MQSKTRPSMHCSFGHDINNIRNAVVLTLGSVCVCVCVCVFATSSKVSRELQRASLHDAAKCCAKMRVLIFSERHC